MAKVYGIHDLELKPGVSAEEFESFVAQEVNTMPPIPGWTWAISKGDRGDRIGKYVMIFEIESVEVLDRDLPLDDGPSPDMKKWFEATDAVFQKFATFVVSAPGEGAPWTDYSVIR